MVVKPNGLLGRKSRVRLQREVLMPRLVSLDISLKGLTVLKAELKSRHSIVT